MVFPQKIKLSDADFARVSRVVYDYCGINLKKDKRELVQSRLAKVVRKSPFHNAGDYLDHVLSDPSQADFVHFIDVLSTNLTKFFRENQHFEYVERILIPRLLHPSGGSGATRIRCWSAGCSSGEEPYSLAITLSEAIPSAQRSNVKILASDISSRMLQTARGGVYPEQRLEGVPPAILKKYFQSRIDEGRKHYFVRDELMRMLVFKQVNLMQPWPIRTPLDFIFCRNVMIYFDKATQQKLVGRFYEVLAPGGTLFIGHSESLSGIQHQFKYIAPTIYQKK